MLSTATRIHVQVTANVARVRVEQEFSNTDDDWVEGLYVSHSQLVDASV